MLLTTTFIMQEKLITKRKLPGVIYMLKTNFYLIHESAFSLKKWVDEF